MFRVKRQEDSSSDSKKCRHCGKQFSNRVQLMSHLQEILKEKTYSCPFCKESISSWKMFLQHKCRRGTKNDNKGEKYICVCAYCGRIFYSETVLQKHNRTQSKACKICNQVFCTMTELRQHNMKHVELFKCNLCSLTFRFEVGLKKHLARNHKTYTCVACKTRYVTQQGYKKHMGMFHSEIRNGFCLKNKETVENNMKTEQKVNEPGLSERDEIDLAVASISDITETENFINEPTDNLFEQSEPVFSEIRGGDSHGDYIENHTGEVETCSKVGYHDNSKFQIICQGDLNNKFEVFTTIASNMNSLETRQSIDNNDGTDSFDGLGVFNNSAELELERASVIKSETVLMNELEIKVKTEDKAVYRQVKIDDIAWPRMNESFSSPASVSVVNNFSDKVPDFSPVKVESLSSLKQDGRDKSPRKLDQVEAFEDGPSCDNEFSMDGFRLHGGGRTVTEINSGHLVKQELVRCTNSVTPVCSVKITSNSDGGFCRNMKKSKVKTFHEKYVAVELLKDESNEKEKKDYGIVKDKSKVDENLGNMCSNKAVSHKMIEVESKPFIPDLNREPDSNFEMPVDCLEDGKCFLPGVNAGDTQDVDIVQVKLENVESGDTREFCRGMKNEAEVSKYGHDLSARSEELCRIKTECLEKDTSSIKSEIESVEDSDESDIEEIFLDTDVEEIVISNCTSKKRHIF